MYSALHFRIPKTGGYLHLVIENQSAPCLKAAAIPLTAGQHEDIWRKARGKNTEGARNLTPGDKKYSEDARAPKVQPRMQGLSTNNSEPINFLSSRHLISGSEVFLGGST